MWELVDAYREYDGGLTSIFLYFQDIAIYIWNRFGILGVAISTMLILAIGIKNDDYGHFFTLVSTNLVRAIGGFVGFGFVIVQNIALLVGGKMVGAVVREYGEKFKGMVSNITDSLEEKKTPRD
jgi:hypothetical protein